MLPGMGDGEQEPAGTGVDALPHQPGDIEALDRLRERQRATASAGQTVGQPVQREPITGFGQPGGPV